VERLQKIIAQAGIASRREAEKMISAGRVSVNNVVVREMGIQADVGKDSIRVDGKLIYPEPDKIYIMLNKPPEYVTTLRDPQGRPTVADLLSSVTVRFFPVGRLDYDSEGMILLTNDGDFAQRILHPRFRVPKVYQVKIKGRLSTAELNMLREGIKLEDGIFLPEDVRMALVNNKSSWLVITLREGRNRVIRRALSSLNHDVVRLIRTRIGNLELGSLKTGGYRFLKKSEVRGLLSFSENDYTGPPKKSP